MGRKADGSSSRPTSEGARKRPNTPKRISASEAQSVKRSRPAANQELANKIAKALRNSKLDGYDINIDVRDGAVILDGFVTHAELFRAQ